MALKITLYAACFLTFSKVMVSAVNTSVEYKLITELLTGYDVNARPVARQNDTVTVKIGMALREIVGLDEKEQAFTTKVWYRLTWKDVRLTWDPKLHNSVSSVRLNPDRVWIPDITLYNDLATVKDFRDQFPAAVSSDGTVSWNFPAVVTSSCTLDMKYFPWDQQACQFQLGSWSYDGNKLDVVNASATGDISAFSKNGEWDLIGMPLRRHVFYYDCCPDPYPDVTFWVVIRRRPLYYVFNLVMPSVFLIASSVFVFILPPESGEKVGLSVTILLASTVFLLLVADSTPAQSEAIPLIAEYFGVAIGLLACCTCMTVLVLYLHHRGSFGYRVPNWVRIVILQGLGRILCMRETIEENLSASGQKVKLNQIKPHSDCIESEYPNGTKQNEVQATQMEETTKSETNRLLRQMLGVLKETQTMKKSKEEGSVTQSDWMLVAMVIDRLLLIIFVCITIIWIPIILTNYPTYSDEHGISE